jgi:hypothetical protein
MRDGGKVNERTDGGINSKGEALLKRGGREQWISLMKDAGGRGKEGRECTEARLKPLTPWKGERAASP